MTDASLSEKQKDLLRAALSTFGGAGRGGPDIVMSSSYSEEDPDASSSLGVSRQQVARAVAWTKSYSWRKIHEVEQVAAAEKLKPPKILVKETLDPYDIARWSLC